MQFRREEVEKIDDALLNLRRLKLVLFERVGVDDRHVDATQIEQRIHVFRGASGHDRQHKHVRPVVDDAGDLGSKTDRCALQQAAGETDRPGIHSIFLRLV